MDVDYQYGVRDRVIPGGQLDFNEIKREGGGSMVGWKYLTKQPKYLNESKRYLKGLNGKGCFSPQRQNQVVVPFGRGSFGLILLDIYK